MTEPPAPAAQQPQRADDSPATVTTTQELPLYAMTVRQVRQLRLAARALMAALILTVLVLGVTLPRSMAYGELFQENLELRTRLSEIDRQMTEVDALMLRLRLYDAQLRGLGEPIGDHGPLSEDMFSGHGVEHQVPVIEDLGEGAPSHALRPAASWADAVQARVEAFLSLAALSEPELAQVVSEMEDLKALERALPSQWPADGTMTSGFGWRRSPFGRTWRFHSGLDIAGRRGTPVYAAAPGRVIVAGYNSGYGRMVEIDHGFGISTVYGHCNSLKVSKGDQVEAGQLVSTIGSTGRSTGPHLHFEVRLDGHPVDPIDYLPR